MRAVNLLPRDEQPRSFAAKRGVAFGAAGGIALVTVALTALMIGAGGAIQQQNAERDSLNAQLAALPHAAADQQESETNVALASERNLRVTALSGALSTPCRLGSCPEPDLSGAAGRRLADEPRQCGRCDGRRQRHDRRRRASRRERHADRLDVLPARRRSVPRTPWCRPGALRTSTCCRARRLDLKPRDLVQFTIQATVKPPGATP